MIGHAKMKDELYYLNATKKDSRLGPQGLVSTS